jgi:DNA polymerase III subunit beta
MQLKVEKDVFLKVITSASGAVNARAPLPILTNLLVQSDGPDKLCVTATDLDLGIRTSCEARVEQEGAVAIPAKKLHDIIRELEPGEIEVTVGKNFAVNIKTKKSFFKIMGLETEDFPKFPEPEPEQAFKLTSRVLRQCLALTAFATSRDEARYTLNGVLLILKGGTARFVATDGKRLASIEKGAKLPQDMELEAIIPAKTVGELLKALSSEEDEVEIVRAQNQMIFQLNNTTIASRLIEGRFPNYEQVIPKGKKTKTQIARHELLAAVKRVSLLTSQENQSVKLDFIKGRLLISSRSPNLGEAKEEIEVDVSGSDLTIGFNPTYLIDVLKNLDVDEISFSLTDPDKPGLIESEGGYQYVVMPMQLT